MEPALRPERLTKIIGATPAVDELGLVVPRGATYGFIGPSGAGKTTCIQTIMSIEPLDPASPLEVLHEIPRVSDVRPTARGARCRAVERGELDPKRIEVMTRVHASGQGLQGWGS